MDRISGSEGANQELEMDFEMLRYPGIVILIENS